MNLVPFTPKPKSSQQAQREIAASCDAVRLAIAQAGSVREAWAIYEHVKHLSNELATLTDEAGKRMEQMLEAM